MSRRQVLQAAGLNESQDLCRPYRLRQCARAHLLHDGRPLLVDGVLAAAQILSGFACCLTFGSFFEDQNLSGSKFDGRRSSLAATYQVRQLLMEAPCESQYLCLPALRAVCPI